MTKLYTLLCSTLLAFSSGLRSADLVWTNTAGGNWATAANWEPNQVPGSGDNAFITNNGTYTVTFNASATLAGFTLGGASGTQTFNHNSGQTLTLNGASTVGVNGAFNLSSGTLTGAGDVTVSGALAWSAGTMSGSGKTIIAGGGTLSVNSGNQHFLERVLRNDGTALWTDGSLFLTSGTFTNNGAFTASSGADLYCYGQGGVNVFANAGTFTKQGVGVTRFLVNASAVAFHNTGTVDVQAGTLQFSSGGANSASILLASATTLSLSASYSHAATSVISGPGTVSVTGGTQTFAAGAQATIGLFALSSGTVDFAGAVGLTNLTFSSGTLTGTGDVTCTGALVWSAGTMSGSGRTIIAGGGTLSVNSGNQHNLERVLQNDGTAAWADGSLWLTGGTFTNNGAFTASSGADLYCYGQGGVNVFANAGTFTKQGAGVTRFLVNASAVAFHNSGTVDVQGGTLGLESGGTHNNDFAMASGATLRLAGTHTMIATVDLIGAGNLSVTGGTTTDAGTVNLGGTATFSQGTATFTGASFAAGVLTVSGGTANLSTSTAITVGGGAISSGTLGGSADVTCTGALAWSAGTMSGSGKTIIAGGGTLSVNSGNQHFLERVLRNDGTALWTDGSLFLTSGTFTNNGAFTASSGADLYCYGQGGVNVFANAGTFTKQGAGVTRFLVNASAVAFHNTGTVDVQAGTLQFSSGGANSASILLASATTLSLSASYSHAATSVISGPGTVSVTGGTQTFAAGAQATIGLFALSSGTVDFAGAVGLTNLTFSSGTLTGTGDVTCTGALVWSAGTMSGSGRTIIAGGGTLSVNSGNQHNLERVLQNDGTAAWADGSLWLTGGTFTNNGAFTASSGADLYCYGQGGVNVFANAGTFTKQGAGVTRFLVNASAVAFHNSGTVDVQGGTLGLESGGTHNNDFAMASGATLRLAGTHTMIATVDLIGAGNLSVTGGTTTDAGTVNLGGTATFSQGTATFTGASFAAGVLTVSGGTANLSTSTAITVGGGAISSGTLGGSADVTCTGALAWSAGTMSGSGKTIIAGGGTLSVNSGNQHFLERVLRNDGTALWTDGSLFLTSGTFTNNGAFTASSGADLYCYGQGGVNVFANAGTFTKQGAGVTRFLVNASAVAFHNTGTVDVQAGTLQFSSGGANSASILLASATTLSLSASYSHAATSVISGPGTVSVTGGTQTFAAGAQATIGLFALSSGTVDFAGAVGLTNLTFSSGTLTGTGDVTCTGALVWSAGTMSGSGRTIIAGGGTLSVNSGNQHNLERVLQNDGTAAWADGSLWLTGGTFTNNGAFTASSGADLYCYGQGGVNVFANAGTFTKQGAGVTRFLVNASAVAFHNSGTVDVQGGTLTFNSGFTQTSGQTMLSGGTVSANSTMQFQGGLLGGAGTISASVNSSGTVSPGASPGLLTITGDYTQNTNGALRIEIAGTTAGTDFDRLAVGGTASLAGALNVNLTNGFYPAANALFTVLTAGTRSGSFANFYFPSNDVGMAMSNAVNSVFVQVINVRPIIPAIADQTLDELTLLSFNANATDADTPAQALTYTLTNSPPDATVSGGGQINWTPLENQGPDITNITVRVTDNGTPNLTVSRTFQVTVNEINVAPVLTTPIDPSVNEQTTYTATATATDADLPVNTFTFALVSGPPGLTVSSAGAIEWMPGEAEGSNSYTIEIRVTDTNQFAVNDKELSTTNMFTLTVNEVNVPPSLTVPANQTITEETLLAVSASATDPDLAANALTFSLVAPPSGMTIHPASGAITWTPDETQGSNTYTIEVVVADFSPFAVNAMQFSVTNSFTVTVNESNRPPVLTLPADQVMTEETTLSLLATATDPDLPANALTFALVSGPTGLTVSSAGAIGWTPGEAQGSNSYAVTVRVTDESPLAINATSLSVTSSFNIVVNESNRPPVLTLPADQVMTEETTLSLLATATDPDLPANALTFALVSGPTGLTVSSAGAIDWIPGEAQGSNSYAVTVRMTDDNPLAINATSLSVTSSFNIVVNESNRPPVLSLPADQVMTEETTLSLLATATDPDLPANALTFALVSGPLGLTVSSGGAIDWTPGEAQGSNSYAVTVRVTDDNPLAINATSLSVTSSFNIVVNESNRPPVLTLPADQVMTEETTLSLLATATDPDLPANALTFALVSGPPGLTVSSAGAIDWTPGEAQGSNSYAVTVRMTDDNPLAINTTSLSVTSSFNIVVNESNRPPVLSLPADQVMTEETTLSLLTTATDPDLPANALTFALVSGPPGLTVSSAGAIDWTPGEAQGSNSYAVTVRVTDDNPLAINATSLSVTSSFNIVVNESNRPPVLSLPADQVMTEETTLSLLTTATDPDLPANALTFALVSGPPGLTVSSAGAIDWTPGEAQGSNSYAVTVRVTDDNPLAINATSLSVTSSFNIVVNESNRPPVVGALANHTVNAGQTVSFTASATDPDLPANVLLFSLINPATGATIDAGSGLFTWRTPAVLADTTNVVQVRVTDDGAPTKSGTNSFTVIINPIAPVVLTAVSYAAGQFTFSVTGPVGPDYVILATTNLVHWFDLTTNAAPATPFNHTDTDAGLFGNRAYRVRLKP